MNINQIRYFITIVECGSFREAADKLALSQPALSNSIKTLEDSLQVQLLERRTHGVLPTSYGKVLFDFFKTALESVQRGRREVELMRDGSKGHVNIGAPVGMIDLFLPEIIKLIANESPGITFGVRYGYLDNLLFALRHGELDFLLTPYWPETLQAEDLEIKKLTDVKISIYARAEHPLAQKSDVTLDDLLDADWMFAQSEGIQALRQELFGLENAHLAKGVITCDHPSFMISVLEKMDLLTIIPDYSVENMVMSGSLKRIEYPTYSPSLSAGLINLTGQHITPSMQLFADTTQHFMESHRQLKP